MQFTKGYFFETEAEALQAVAYINQGEGIPRAGSHTKTYCEPASCVGGFYLPSDDVTKKYLGTPTDIKIEIPNLLKI